jgi:putative flippase GtrA
MPMGLVRQGSTYLIIGLVQLLLDWLVFVVATALGMPVAPANVGGRLAGMLLGFWLNGRYTFAHADGARLGWRRFTRFFGVWLLLTAASTLLMSLVDHALGLQYTWLAKPLVEGGLACVSFLMMRYVVFR